MNEKTRLFKSIWAYAFWFLLMSDSVWHDWRHSRLGNAPLQPAAQIFPIIFGIANLCGSLVCIYVVFCLYKFTTNRLEQAGVFLVGLSFVLSISLSLNRLGWLPVVIPFHASVSLLLDTPVAVITLIRLVQVVSEGPMNSAFQHVMPARNE